MADQNTPVDLGALHDAILAAIKAAFPSLAYVDDYPLDRKPKAVPACLVECDEMEPANDEDSGTGQQSLALHFNARLILPFRTATAGREIRIMAAALSALVHENRWGQFINPAEVLGCFPDAFDPDLDQYLVWRVEWRQVGQFGVSVWADTGPAVPGVYLGFSPNIGPDHLADYIKIPMPTASGGA